MKTRSIIAKSVWLFLCLMLIAGCDTALTVGSRTIGVSSGNFIYTDGYLMTSYNYPIDKTLKICEKTLLDMKATIIEKKQKISTATITATAYDEKINIMIEYILKDQTSVSVRVGLSGNNIASQLIHDKIAENLMKASIAEKP